jgi:hypothetical protein
VASPRIPTWALATPEQARDDDSANKRAGQPGQSSTPGRRVPCDRVGDWHGSQSQSCIDEMQELPWPAPRRAGARGVRRPLQQGASRPRTSAPPSEWPGLWGERKRSDQLSPEAERIAARVLTRADPGCCMNICTRHALLCRAGSPYSRLAALCRRYESVAARSMTSLADGPDSVLAWRLGAEA